MGIKTHKREDSHGGKGQTAKDHKSSGFKSDRNLRQQ